MKLYIRLSIVFLFTLISISNLIAEEVKSDEEYFTRIQYGLFGHYMLTFHNSDFTGFKDWETCCPKFESGSGSGFAVGVLIEYPLSETWFISGRLAYESSITEMKDSEKLIVALDGEPAEGEFEYMISTDLSDIFTELLVGYKPVNRLSLYAGAHLTFAPSYFFDMRETMLRPVDRGTFENGSRVRNDATGEEIPDAASFGFALAGGVSYELPLNRRQTLRLVPEMFFTIGLTDYTENIDWSGNSVRFGLALKYSDAGEYPLHAAVSSPGNVEIIKYKSCGENYARFFPQEIIIKPYAEAAAAIANWNLDIYYKGADASKFSGIGNVPEKLVYNLINDSAMFVIDEGPCEYRLSVEDIYGVSTEAWGSFELLHKSIELSIAGKIAAVKPDGSIIDPSISSPLKLKRNITTEITPLLNYIFFDKMSAKFPDRYSILNKNEAEKFTLEKLHKAGTMGTYYSILNVIGKRLKDNPEATVTLAGCNDGKESGKDNMKISGARAQKVKRYFSDIWQIDENRMKIFVSKSRGGTPKKMSLSSSKTDRGRANAENRRVEIIPDANFEYIIKPVLTRDTVIESSLDRITIRHRAKTNVGIKFWSAKLIEGGEILSQFSGTDDLPETIEFKIEDIKERINRLDGPINCEFTVIDQNNLRCGIRQNISVDLNIIDSSHYKYSLILFDFSSFKIKAKNRKIIDLMGESVRADADVSISGFTDIVGDSLFNLNFSKRRAMATSEKLFGMKFETVDDNTFEDSSSEVLLSDFKFQFVDEKKTKIINLTISGKGETLPLLHDNTFPEGRFYCRTVIVDIVNKTE